MPTPPPRPTACCAIAGPSRPRDGAAPGCVTVPRPRRARCSGLDIPPGSAICPPATRIPPCCPSPLYRNIIRIGARCCTGSRPCRRSWSTTPVPSLAADGVPADHLAVTSGALDGIERALTAHLRPGDRVAVEDPGWANLLDLLAALGLSAEPVRVDDDGPLVADVARALGRGVRALIVTTRAQNPTGAALSAQRAGELRGLLAGRVRRSAARRGRSLRRHFRCALALVGRIDQPLGVRAVGIEGLRSRPAGGRARRRSAAPSSGCMGDCAWGRAG